MSQNKKKIIFGISLIIAAIVLIMIGVILFATIPNTAHLMFHDGLKFFGGIMSCALGIVGLIGGVCMIADGLDLF